LQRSWTREEDDLLLALVDEFYRDGRNPRTATPSWSIIAIEFCKRLKLERTGKQCRERYANHLQPGVKKGGWTKEEDDLILSLQGELGNQWAKMMEFLPGRSDNSIKNRFWSFHRSKSRAEFKNFKGVKQPKLKFKELALPVALSRPSSTTSIASAFSYNPPTSTSRGRNTLSPQRYGGYYSLDNLTKEVFEDGGNGGTPILRFKKRRVSTSSISTTSSSSSLVGDYLQNRQLQQKDQHWLSHPKGRPALTTRVSEDDTDSEDDEIVETDPNAYDLARGIGSSRNWLGYGQQVYGQQYGRQCGFGQGYGTVSPLPMGNTYPSTAHSRSSNNNSPTLSNPMTSIPEISPVAAQNYTTPNGTPGYSGAVAIAMPQPPFKAVGYVSNADIESGKVVFEWPEELTKDKEEGSKDGD